MRPKPGWKLPRPPRPPESVDVIHIVFINRYFYPDISATSQLLSDLAIELASDGYRVDVVTGRSLYNSENARLATDEVIWGVKVHRVWASSFGRQSPLRLLDYLTFYMSAALKTFALSDGGTILIAKTDPPLLSVLTGVVCRVRRARAINWLQDVFPEVAERLRVRIPRPVLAALKVVRDWSLKSAQLNVAIGVHMKTVLRLRGVPEDALAIIPNWADGDSIRPASSTENRFRAEWGFESSFVVCYSGNMGRAHDFRDIIAAAQLLQSDPRIQFLFIGDGKARSEVERACAEIGLKNVNFRPYQPRELLGQSLTVADVHLVCLRPEMEGFVVPSKVFGALAAGVPVIYIGDPNGEVAQLIRQPLECGMAVSARNVEALAATIRELAENPSLRQELGANGRQLFMERYDKRVAMTAWKRAISSVTAG